ncbi:uncharacterized protein [Apostichopus japonicus]|uniref:uncharacterized protein isoform X1 n=1 Tax=Stichopus japonicus TaxID=307972 RepID=UPI003AB565D5
MNGNCGSGDPSLPTQADESRRPPVQNENTQRIGSSESDARQQLEFENELLREPLQVRELRVEELEMTNRLLLSQHWFHSQEFVVREEADTPITHEVGEVLDLPTQTEPNQNIGEDLMVSNGQEMVQASINEEPVIKKCQLCSDPFQGNHVFQVTHCHLCDRFLDHGPYDALPRRVNWDPTITVH